MLSHRQWAKGLPTGAEGSEKEEGGVKHPTQERENGRSDDKRGAAKHRLRKGNTRIKLLQSITRCLRNARRPDRSYGKKTENDDPADKLENRQRVTQANDAQEADGQ